MLSTQKITTVSNLAHRKHLSFEPSEPSRAGQFSKTDGVGRPHSSPCFAVVVQAEEEAGRVCRGCKLWDRTIPVSMPSSTTQLPSIRMASHGICTLFPVKTNRSPGTRKRDSSSWTPAESMRWQSQVRFFPTKTESNNSLNWKSMKKQPGHFFKKEAVSQHRLKIWKQ